MAFLWKVTAFVFSFLFSVFFLLCIFFFFFFFGGGGGGGVNLKQIKYEDSDLK